MAVLRRAKQILGGSNSPNTVPNHIPPAIIVLGLVGVGVWLYFYLNAMPTAHTASFAEVSNVVANGSPESSRALNAVDSLIDRTLSGAPLLSRKHMRRSGELAEGFF